MGDQGGTVQVQKRDVKMTCFGRCLEQSGGFVEPQVLGGVIMRRMQNDMARAAVVIGRREIGLVKIAAEAAIDQVLVAVITAVGDWNEMVYGELTARVFFADTAIAATALVTPSHHIVLGMRRHA